MTESKKGTDEAPHIRIDLKLDDTIFVSVEYNLEKVIELLKAYSIYGCLPADIDRPVEVTTNCSLEKDEQRNHWYGEVTTSVGDSECILDWYKNTCESENTSGEEIRAHEQRAHQTEPHLRSIIWTVTGDNSTMCYCICWVCIWFSRG